MVGQRAVDQLPYGKGGQIDGKGELNLRRRDVEACGNRRQRGLVHGEREGAERNERGDQPLSPGTRSERRRFDLPTHGTHRRRSGWAIQGWRAARRAAPHRGGRSSITLIDATTKPAGNETGERSVALKEGSGSGRALRRGSPQPRSPVTATGRAPRLQKCGDLLQVQAVEDALWRDTAFAGHEYAPAGEVEFIDRVCVRVDAEHAAQFQGSAMPSPVQVEPVGIRIDFNRYSARHEEPCPVSRAGFNVT